ncbi:replicative DNA helicase [Aquibaculum arenosum]|uniref:Replicative DNA helicase n=1 Tax=Aquibaculum arenosum TaxID=3032591 RepID=A0ABT5YI63_9PROT|nr:replicative DNA helicase [Fodinicurvata sp. CAU 1616]MDF2094574.1 replicative DNA helicase [Fodinicurvata sp. CAU 1616]
MEPTQRLQFVASEEESALQRLPPHNLEAEQALLAAILHSNHAYEKVSDFLLPEHFADGAHERIYRACGKLIERGQLANAITLKGFFDQDGGLADVGGAAYLAELQAAPVNPDVRHYGRLIHDLFLRRELIALAQDIDESAYEQDPDSAATNQIEQAEQRLYSLAETGLAEGGLQPFSGALTEAVTLIEAAYRRDGALAGLATHFAEIDKLLGGLHRSDLIILAGRPSMGKTALATNIAFNVAKSRRLERGPDGQSFEEPETVAFFSLEMSAEQLAGRILSEQSGVRSDSLRKGAITQEDFDKVFDAARELQALRLFIDDTPAISVPALRTRARRLKRQHGLSLIVVDYLQLMTVPGGGKSDSRVQEVSEITRGLKAIAKELDVPVIALSQLSRQVEQREDKRPQLSDLRESGSIEQDADMVLFVYREQYYLERAEPMRRENENDEKYHERYERWKQRCEEVYGLAEVIVAKQRHGPIGIRKLTFDGDTTRFGDYIADEYLPDAH